MKNNIVQVVHFKNDSVFFTFNDKIYFSSSIEKYFASRKQFLKVKHSKMSMSVNLYVKIEENILLKSFLSQLICMTNNPLENLNTQFHNVA